MGLVGLPNVGKSTTFNFLCKQSVPSENFPFCTIDPHEARMNVPDQRFKWLCQHYKPKSEVPATLTIYDIAGLVPGAHLGEGLGNAFLSHIQVLYNTTNNKHTSALGPTSLGCVCSTCVSTV